MSITGKAYSADEALEMGLVSEIVERENIAEAVSALADQICENAPLAIQSGMRAMQKMSSIPEGERYSYLKAELDKLLRSEDAREGTNAFKEKRKPIWKNR